MSLFAYVDAPRFVAGAELHVTAGIDLIARNAVLLDLFSLGGRDVQQAHAAYFEPIGDNPLQYWLGAFRYRTGMTTLAVVMNNTLTGSVVPRLRIKLGPFTGSSTVTFSTIQETLLTSGNQTISYGNLHTLGYGDGQMVEVALEIFDTNGAAPGDSNGDAGWPGQYRLIDCWVAPVAGAMTWAWPGTPTFTTVVDTAKLLRLSNACDWLAQRMNLVPMNLFQGVSQATGLYWSPTTHPIWSGGAGVGREAFDRLRMQIYYRIVHNQQETLALRINGSDVATVGPLNAGAVGGQLFDVNISGYSSSTPLRIELQSRIAADPTVVGQPQPSRYTMTRCWLDRASVSPAAAPQQTLPLETMTMTTLANRLNALSSILLAVYNRIQANTDRWDRVRVFRRGYGYDDGQRTYFAVRHSAQRANRIGAALIVYGTNIVAGYGPFTVIEPEEIGGEYRFDYAFEETLIGGDARAVKVVSLEGLPGLQATMAYVLKSTDARYAAEYLLR